MTYSVTVQDFADWRRKARAYLAAHIRPHDILWGDAHAQAATLFDDSTLPSPAPMAQPTLNVPVAFIDLARSVATHRDERRWGLLYEALYRLTHGERHVLKLDTDPCTHALRMLEKNVRRDIHKMKAFVRFRRIADDDGAELYVAWHCPDHRIVRLAAPFFAKRFEVMRWMILTPDESVRWDGENLFFAPGASADMAPAEDAMEDVWRSYYRATFNPARIKIKCMKREMPVRHWKTLPETTLIADMLKQAPSRVDEMIAQSRKMLMD